MAAARSCRAVAVPVSTTTEVNPHREAGALLRGGPDATHAVLGLHGRGQSPAFIDALRERVRGANSERLHWHIPAAHGGEWYPFRFMSVPPPDDPWLPWSIEAVSAALDDLDAAGFPCERTVLLGFSQGACLAAHYALTRPRRFAGIALLTGGHLGPDGVDPHFAGDFAGTPALLASRAGDAWVPERRVQETADRLGALGATVTVLIEPPGEHVPSEASIHHLRCLLEAL